MDLSQPMQKTHESPGMTFKEPDTHGYRSGSPRVGLVMVPMQIYFGHPTFQKIVKALYYEGDTCPAQAYPQPFSLEVPEAAVHLANVAISSV
jgi:hypothetical protein